MRLSEVRFTDMYRLSFGCSTEKACHSKTTHEKNAFIHYRYA
jgi:hypothetical protein